MQDYLENHRMSSPGIKSSFSFNDILTHCNAHYVTSGLQSLNEISDNSIDFLFSEATLEHVYKSEFYEFLCETKRILKRGSYCSHTIDLRDHLGGGLNNLRFTTKVWESKIFKQSGFYTNRYRYSQILTMFKKAGFEIVNIKKKEYTKLPIKKNKLAREYCNLPTSDLLVLSFSILLFCPEQ